MAHERHEVAWSEVQGIDSVGRKVIILSGAGKRGKDRRVGKEVCHGKGLGGEERKAWSGGNVDGDGGRPTVMAGAKGVDRAKMGARDGGAAGTRRRRCAWHVCGKATH